MSSLLDGRTAAVTGAASGIGRAIAVRFAQEGADVVVADVRREPRGDGRPTVEVIESDTDAEARFQQTDVTDPEQLTAAAAAADAFGGLDVMVNNAGVPGPMGGVAESSLEAYRQLRAVNLDGVFYGSKVAAAAMDEGTIVNVSSAAGIEGYGDIVPYSAAKGGVRLLTYALAADLGPSIRVNAVHPGLTDTAMSRQDAGMVGSSVEEAFNEETPLGRTAEPREIADAVVFLASDLASYVSGASLLVDGGLTNTV